MCHLKKSKLALIICASLASAAPAWAETAASKTTEPETRSALTTVIVTGEKIARPLEKTLSSVAVTTAEDLQTYADADLHDVFLRTPGMFATEGNNTFSIRGIPFDGLGAGSSDVISVYIDDTLQTRRSVTFAPSSMWDMNQVEIYRGSQSLIQGRNALAGSIVIKSKDPTYTPEGAVRVNAGTYGERGASAAVSGGLIDDVLAARLSVDFQEDDGYIENVFLGKKANSTETLTARGKLLFQPTADLDVLLTLVHNHNEMGNQSVRKTEEGEVRFYEIATNADGMDEVTVNSATARVDYRMDDSWTLTSITSASENEYNGVLDYDYEASLRDDTAFVNDDEELVSQELRLAYSNSETFTALLGAYFYKTKRQSASVMEYNLADFFGLTSLFELYDDGFRFRYDRGGDIEITSAAVFGEINWEFIPDWQAIVGLRYDHERNTTSNSKGTSQLTPFNNISPAIDERLAGQIGVSDPTVNESTVGAWLPKVGLSYSIADNQTLGLVAQRGYRAGGASFNLATMESVEFDPEYTNNYELAYRGIWLDQRLRFSANIYRIDWENQQVEVLTNPSNNNSSEIQNAGESRLKGGEIALAYFVTPGLEVYAGMAYNDAEYKEFVTDTQDFTGYEFTRAPLWSFNAGVNYRMDNGLAFNLGTVYYGETSSTYLTEEDEELPTFKQVTEVLEADGFVLWNASTSYYVGDWLLSAYVKNLADKEYVTNNQEGNTADVGAPRTAGISVRYDF